MGRSSRVTLPSTESSARARASAVSAGVGGAEDEEGQVRPRRLGLHEAADGQQGRARPAIPRSRSPPPAASRSSPASSRAPRTASASISARWRRSTVSVAIPAQGSEDEDAFRRRLSAFRCAHPRPGGRAPFLMGTPVSTPWNSRSGGPRWIAVRRHPHLADGALVGAAALLQHRGRDLQLARVLEVAQDDHRVGEVAQVDRRLHARAEEAVLGHDHQRGHAALARGRRAARGGGARGGAPRAWRSGSRSGCR